MALDERNDPDKKFSFLIFFLYLFIILVSIMIVGMVWTMFDPELSHIPAGLKQLFNSL